MSASMKHGKGQKYRTQLVGQAGVWRVAAELAMRGHIPLFPGIDHGYDIMIENGLRLQVKSAHAKLGHPGYPDGAYAFDSRQYTWGKENTRQRNSRSYTKDADFFVFWGIEDNKFWIMATGEFRSGIWFTRATPVMGDKNYKRVTDRRLAYENRWDLLDVSNTSRALIESVVTDLAVQEKV